MQSIGQPGRPDSGFESVQNNTEAPEVNPRDPLSFMSEKDKWGLKGFTYLMKNYPDYAADVIGQDDRSMGFDLLSDQ